MFGLRYIYACLVIFLNYSRLLYPSDGVHYSTVGDDLCLECVVDGLDSAVEVDTLP